MKTLRIGVIGSTGRTGRLVLDEGIRHGHAMTAFTQRAQELAGARGLAAVVSGDGRNLADVRRAVQGKDAVISIVSSEGLGRTTVMSDVMRAELAAMRAAGVRRLVVVSVSAIEGSRPWFFIQLVRWLLRKPYADFGRMEGLVRSSGLEWTIVRPPRLTNGPATGRVRSVAGEKEVRHWPYTIARAHLAASLIDLAGDANHAREIVLVSASPRSRRNPGPAPAGD